MLQNSWFYRFKKVDVVSQSASEGNVVSDSADITNTNASVNSISVEQYNHLVELLSNHRIQNSNATESLVALAGKTCLLSASFNSIWLDSGATYHICPTLDDFSEFKVITDSDNKITIPDEKQVTTLHIGNVKLNGTLQLQDVLHVPDFQFKLLSVHKLCKDLNCQMLFSDDKCFVQDHSQKGQPILLGNLRNGLYIIDHNSLITAAEKHSK